MRVAAKWSQKDAIASFKVFVNDEDLDENALACNYHRTNAIYFKNFKAKDVNEELITITIGELKELVKECMSPESGKE